MPTLALQGTITELPEGTVFRPIDDRLRCDPPPDHRVVSLVDDAAFEVSLDGLDGVNVFYAESDFPITILIDSDAGAAQSLPLELLYLRTRAVPITGIFLVRVAGQATQVRLILGQEV